MSPFAMPLKRAFLTSAAFVALSAPAFAVPTVIGSGQPVPVNQPQQQSDGETTQIRLDDGSIISFVGEAGYRITDTGEIIVESGNITVLSGGSPLTIRMGGTTVSVNGGAALSLNGGTIISHVLSGTTSVTASGDTRSFSAGQAWQSQGGSISRIIAAGPQAVTGISGAARQGLPITLGEALAALGADADIVAAARQLDAIQQGISDVSSPALPANLANLLDFQAQLAARIGALGGFNGGSPAIIDAYLRFLVGGGQIAQFQSAYLALVTSYLELLTSGGAAGDFTGLSSADIQAYLDYLESVGGLGQLGADQQALIAEYLAFLRGGGNPNAFIPTNVQLDQATADLYRTTLESFIAFIRAGGQPGDFTGVDQALLARYIQLLASAGLLDTLFGAQADILQAYANFLAGGGSPNDFPQIDDFGLSEALIAEYTQALQSFLTFLFEGGSIGDFNGDPVALAAFIQQLEQADALAGALPEQRAVLLAFVQFLADGNAAADFRGFLALGLSDAVVQTYTSAINTFLTFVIDGGAIADFDGDLSILLAYIADLQAAGEFQGAFDADVRDALIAFQAFIAEGNAAADFTGFEPLRDTGGGTTGPDTVPGISDSNEVTTVTALNTQDIADFDFRNSRGASLLYFPTAGGNYLINTRTFNFPRFATTTDDNGLPSQTGFRVQDMELIAAEASGDVLMTRHSGSGTATVGGTFSDFDGTTFLDTVFVANASTVLPTSGQITYDLDRTLGIQVLGYQGDVDFDMVAGLRFGTVPVIAINAVLNADAQYIYSTGDDGLSVLDFAATNGVQYGFPLGASVDLVSGTGVFCAETSQCFAFVTLIPNQDYSQLGGTFITRSSSGDDAAAYLTVSLVARDGYEIATVVPEVSPSGSVTAPFGATRANLLFTSAGSSNSAEVLLAAIPSVSLEFDDQGLSSMFAGFSNEVPRGDGVVVDLAGDENWQVGRWIGQIGSTIYGPDSGRSYAVIPLMDGTPANGRVEYSLLGASRPVYGHQATAPGTFMGSAVLVLGTQALFGLDGTVTMPDAVYRFVTNGGLSDPSVTLSFRQSQLGGFIGPSDMNFTMEGDGAACPNGIEECQARIQVAVGGNNAEYAGISYQIRDNSFQLPGLSGTAVFGGELVPEDTGPNVEGTERTNQFVAYAANTIGIDGRNPATVIYDDTTGAPLYYRWDLNDFTRERERPEIGTAVQREAGSVDGVLGWARWTEGATAGRYYSSNSINLPANAGWHIISGTPATNLPTSGTVSYDLIGNTNPTIRDGSVAPGTLDSARAAVAFGTVARVGMELGLTIGGEGYNISTIGGVNDLSQGLEVIAQGEDGAGGFGGNAFQGTVTGSGGSLCGGDIAGCNASLVGWLAGEGASHMGVAYTLGNTGFDQQIDGVAAFAQAGSGGGSGSSQASSQAPDMGGWTRWDGTTQTAIPNPVPTQGSEPTYRGADESGPVIPDWISFER